VCAHDEEDDGEAATDAQKVTSESVRWAYDTFGTVISTTIDSCKECSWNGECQDADGGYQQLVRWLSRVNPPDCEWRVTAENAVGVVVVLVVVPVFWHRR
jgi:hypothetical protein